MPRTNATISGEDDKAFQLGDGGTVVDRDDGSLDVCTTDINFSLTTDGELDATSQVAAVNALKRIVRSLLHERKTLRQHATDMARHLNNIKDALGALDVLSILDFDECSRRYLPS